MLTSRLSAVAVCSTFVLSSLAPAQVAQPAAPISPPSAVAPAQDKPANKAPIYDENADAKQQIAAAQAKAAKENRRVLIQWGANWCGWCHKLHELSASDKDIRKELMYEYDVVLVDIGKWDKNMDLATSYGADLKKHGVPYLTVVDGAGKVLANQDTGELENGDHHDPAKVMAFLKDHQAEYLTAESVLSDGLKRAKESNKVVFLHFGAPWCGWCHRLEDWMARPEISSLLAKDFVEVKIDEDRMLGGKDLEKRYTEPVGIPWFAFINPQTNDVIATSIDPKSTKTSPKGDNIGFPAQESEIAHFGEMLHKACRNMSPADIDKLLASLKEANRKSS